MGSLVYRSCTARQCLGVSRTLVNMSIQQTLSNVSVCMCVRKGMRGWLSGSMSSRRRLNVHATPFRASMTGTQLQLKRKSSLISSRKQMGKHANSHTITPQLCKRLSNTCPRTSCVPIYSRQFVQSVSKHMVTVNVYPQHVLPATMPIRTNHMNAFHTRLSPQMKIYSYRAKCTIAEAAKESSYLSLSASEARNLSRVLLPRFDLQKKFPQVRLTTQANIFVPKKSQIHAQSRTQTHTSKQGYSPVQTQSQRPHKVVTPFITSTTQAHQHSKLYQSNRTQLKIQSKTKVQSQTGPLPQSQAEQTMRTKIPLNKQPQMQPPTNMRKHTRVQSNTQLIRQANILSRPTQCSSDVVERALVIGKKDQAKYMNTLNVNNTKTVENPSSSRTPNPVRSNTDSLKLHRRYWSKHQNTENPIFRRAKSQGVANAQNGRSKGEEVDTSNGKIAMAGIPARHNFKGHSYDRVQTISMQAHINTWSPIQTPLHIPTPLIASRSKCTTDDERGSAKKTKDWFIQERRRRKEDREYKHTKRGTSVQSHVPTNSQVKPSTQWNTFTNDESGSGRSMESRRLRKEGRILQRNICMPHVTVHDRVRQTILSNASGTAKSQTNVPYEHQDNFAALPMEKALADHARNDKMSSIDVTCVTTNTLKERYSSAREWRKSKASRREAVVRARDERLVRISDSRNITPKHVYDIYFYQDKVMQADTTTTPDLIETQSINSTHKSNNRKTKLGHTPVSTPTTTSAPTSTPKTIRQRKENRVLALTIRQVGLMASKGHDPLYKGWQFKRLRADVIAGHVRLNSLLDIKYAGEAAIHWQTTLRLYPRDKASDEKVSSLVKALKNKVREGVLTVMQLKTGETMFPLNKMDALNIDISTNSEAFPKDMISLNVKHEQQQRKPKLQLSEHVLHTHLIEVISILPHLHGIGFNAFNTAFIHATPLAHEMSTHSLTVLADVAATSMEILDTSLQPITLGSRARMMCEVLSTASKKIGEFSMLDLNVMAHATAALAEPVLVRYSQAHSNLVKLTFSGDRSGRSIDALLLGGVRRPVRKRAEDTRSLVYDKPKKPPRENINRSCSVAELNSLMNHQRWHVHERKSVEGQSYTKRDSLLHLPMTTASYSISLVIDMFAQWTTALATELVRRGDNLERSLRDVSDTDVRDRERYMEMVAMAMKTKDVVDRARAKYLQASTPEFDVDTPVYELENKPAFSNAQVHSSATTSEKVVNAEMPLQANTHSHSSRNAQSTSTRISGNPYIMLVQAVQELVVRTLPECDMPQLAAVAEFFRHQDHTLKVSNNCNDANDNERNTVLLLILDRLHGQTSTWWMEKSPLWKAQDSPKRLLWQQKQMFGTAYRPKRKLMARRPEQYSLPPSRNTHIDLLRAADRTAIKDKSIVSMNTNPTFSAAYKSYIASYRSRFSTPHPSQTLSTYSNKQIQYLENRLDQTTLYNADGARLLSTPHPKDLAMIVSVLGDASHILPYDTRRVDDVLMKLAHMLTLRMPDLSPTNVTDVLEAYTKVCVNRWQKNHEACTRIEGMLTTAIDYIKSHPHAFLGQNLHRVLTAFTHLGITDCDAFDSLRDSLKLSYRSLSGEEMTNVVVSYANAGCTLWRRPLACAITVLNRDLSMLCTENLCRVAFAMDMFDHNIHMRLNLLTRIANRLAGRADWDEQVHTNNKWRMRINHERCEARSSTPRNTDSQTEFIYQTQGEKIPGLGEIGLLGEVNESFKVVGLAQLVSKKGIRSVAFYKAVDLCVAVRLNEFSSEEIEKVVVALRDANCGTPMIIEAMEEHANAGSV